MRSKIKVSKRILMDCSIVVHYIIRTLVRLCVFASGDSFLTYNMPHLTFI